MVKIAGGEGGDILDKMVEVMRQSNDTTFSLKPMVHEKRKGTRAEATNQATIKVSKSRQPTESNNNESVT